MTTTRFDTRAPRSLHDPDVRDGRFLSREACRALADRIFAMRTGGGDARLQIDSTWSSGSRWARNTPMVGSESQETRLTLSRTIAGAGTNGWVTCNSLEDGALHDFVHRAERMVTQYPQDPETYPVPFVDSPNEVHPHSEPNIWFDTTAKLDADALAATVARIFTAVKSAGLVAAGEIGVYAKGAAYLDTEQVFRYYPYTTAQYSVTVRDAAGTASGWAGVDFADWSRIDVDALTHKAIDKCDRSRNPVAIEPGRYTAILEPQAVCDLIAPIFDRAMDREAAERGWGPFAAGRGMSKIGQRLLDRRISITADPMDPDLGFVPFNWSGEPYVNTAWFADGFLRQLEYSRPYGLLRLNKDWALPNSGAFHVSGGTMSIEDMIAKTDRGLLVTRFNEPRIIDIRSMLLSTNTRDGLWLVERGKISKAVKNLHCVESPLFAFNNVQFLGVPQRAFRPFDGPAVCPPITVLDFNFSAVTDAV